MVALVKPLLQILAEIDGRIDWPPQLFFKWPHGIEHIIESGRANHHQIYVARSLVLAARDRTVYKSKIDAGFKRSQGVFELLEDAEGLRQ